MTLLDNKKIAFSFILTFLFLGFHLQADSRKVLAAALASKDMKKAKAVINELAKTEEGKDAARNILKVHLNKILVKYKTQLKKCESGIKNLKSEAKIKTYFSFVDKWAPKAEETLTFIFDEVKYPLPPMPFNPGKDVQVNQAVVEAMVENVIQLWNLQEFELCKLLGIKAKVARKPGGGGYAKKLSKGKIQDPCKDILSTMYYKFTDCSGALKKINAKWKDNYKKYLKVRDELIDTANLAKKTGIKLDNVPKMNLLINATYLLFNDKIKTALNIKNKLNDDQKRIFKDIRYRYLLLKSMSPDGDWTKEEKKALLINNLYRLSLGLAPMLGNKKLQQAAIKHSKYQKKHGMGHGEKDPTRATPFQRVALEKYNGGGVTENVFSGTNALAGVWMWRMDSGHHKNLIRSGSRAVGISGRGPATHNTGNSTEDPLIDEVFL